MIEVVFEQKSPPKLSVLYKKFTEAKKIVRGYFRKIQRIQIQIYTQTSIRLFFQCVKPISIALAQKQTLC